MSSTAIEPYTISSLPSPSTSAVRVRYVWAGVSPTSAHWEQAFSVDGGRTWVTNWIMGFSRGRPSAF
ncbi:hypothetical protein [Streptomyces gilvus]|uniref:hypothetical protein n=1 Tax=Streptomyces gilvus TaxID=2920937 RepID=UPI001F0D4823|nr:hypothetical protein [Streptomyces sp. CME 23]MCH5670484.1 hypothetical protein [Streptomyces sp. CME 23]